MSIDNFELKCILCNEILWDPILVPCCHVPFCFLCLRDKQEEEDENTSDDKSTVNPKQNQCPSCRRSWKFIESTIAWSSANHPVGSSVEDDEEESQATNTGIEQYYTAVPKKPSSNPLTRSKEKRAALEINLEKLKVNQILKGLIKKYYDKELQDRRNIRLLKKRPKFFADNSVGIKLSSPKTVKRLTASLESSSLESNTSPNILDIEISNSFTDSSKKGGSNSQPEFAWDILYGSSVNSSASNSIIGTPLSTSASNPLFSDDISPTSSRNSTISENNSGVLAAVDLPNAGTLQPVIINNYMSPTARKPKNAASSIIVSPSSSIEDVKQLLMNDYWEPDDAVSHCNACRTEFTFVRRKHHCRCCGKIFCANCCNQFANIKEQKARVCSACYDYVTTQVAIVELVSTSRAHRKNMKKIYVEYRNSTNWVFDSEARKKFGIELWYTSKLIDGMHWIRGKAPVKANACDLLEWNLLKKNSVTKQLTPNVFVQYFTQEEMQYSVVKSFEGSSDGQYILLCVSSIRLEDSPLRYDMNVKYNSSKGLEFAKFSFLLIIGPYRKPPRLDSRRPSRMRETYVECLYQVVPASQPLDFGKRFSFITSNKVDDMIAGKDSLINLLLNMVMDCQFQLGQASFSDDNITALNS